MALDERYFISLPINQYFVDKDTGLPLSGGTLTFYRDSSRNIPKEVFQLTGAPGSYTYISLGSEVTLSAVGTVQNDGGDNVIIYFYPYDDLGEIDLYYIECHSAGGVEQFTREAWPNLTTGNNPLQDNLQLQNQLANPQFSRVFINSNVATTYTVAGSATTFQFAPDWFFRLTGTGSVTVTRTAVAGISEVPTNPPYYITVSVGAGVTSCKMIQRLNVNSGLWSSTATQDTYLSTVLVGRNELPGSASIEMYYAESTGSNPDTVILSGTLVPSDWKIIQGIEGGVSEPIPESTDSNSGTSGYVDIYVLFPNNSTTSITSLQVVPVLTATDASLAQYDERSSNREQALMGDYFIPNLEAKQISSLLTGWDFPLNPAQWGSSGTLASTNPLYMWDQTIVKDTGAAVTYARNTVTGGLQFTTPTTTNAVAICQFLTAPEAEKILGNYLSVNVNAFRNAAGAAVTMRVYLYAGTSAANFPSIASNQFIATLNTDGTLTTPFTGWTEIPREGLPTASATLSTVDMAGTDWSQLNNAANDIGFNNWRLTTDATIKNTHKFAIVVTFAYATTATVIVVNSISCVPGNIPCRPGAKTFDQTYLDCEYYYRKSFLPGTTPARQTSSGGGGSPISGEEIFPGVATGIGNNVSSTIRFINPMVAAPTTVTFYNPVNNDAFAYDFTAAASTTATTAGNVTAVGFYIVSARNPGGITAGDTLGVHWTADARLGL